jgi:glycosyltransferase-like protein
MLTYSTKPRGGVVHALNLSEALHDLGHEVHLFSLKRKGEKGFPHGFYKKTRIPFDVFNHNSTGKTVGDVRRMIDAYIKHLPLDFDIYHTQDCVGANSLYEMKRTRELKAPTVRTIHHVDEFRGKTLTEFQEKSIHLLDEKIVVSKYWKNVLRRDFKVNAHLVHNGIDLAKFSPSKNTGKRSRKPSILYVGGLEARKGVEYLLLATELVQKEIPDTKLTIIGRAGLTSGESYNEREMFESLADRIGMGSSVIFRDFVSEGRLKQYYQRCDVYVLPSRMEGWGLTLMEAMAFKKPVVASRVGGIPELVDHGKNGLLVPCGDVKGLADSIVRILRDRKLATSFGQAARKKVELFTWNRTAKMTLKIYEKALKRQS